MFINDALLMLTDVSSNYCAQFFPYVCKMRTSSITTIRFCSQLRRRRTSFHRGDQPAGSAIRVFHRNSSTSFRATTASGLRPAGSAEVGLDEAFLEVFARVPGRDFIA